MYEKYKSKLTSLEYELTNSSFSVELNKGISIIIPIYDGLDYIDKCLNSLMNQVIVNAKFEVILVFNGKFNKDLSYILEKKYNSNLDIILLINDEQSAGAARNLGVQYAKYSHVTFIDIDDYVSQDFIQSNFNYLEGNTIVFSQIHNVENDQIIEENSLNLEILRSVGKEKLTLGDLNRISTITACKSIPKSLALTQDYRSHLRSGEDTVYFCELFTNNRPSLKIIPIEENAIYFRIVRENSVSRKSSSYDFLITQRLEILEILDRLLSIAKNKQVQHLIRSKYRAQIVFMNRFLKNNIKYHPEIIETIQNMDLKYFEFSILNKGLAEKLIISYCFPPYSDTSATIMAKRILESTNIVDAVSNNLNKIRKKEYSLQKMIQHLIGTRTIINSTASFSNMFYLNKFVDESVKVFLKNIDRYKEIHSRAMFPISHFPPFFMKIIKPSVKWTAEFSDPLLIDINSEQRFSEIENDWLIKSLGDGILGDFTKYIDNNLFNLMEIIPFSLADELVFTNENQLEFMISRFTESEKNFIRSKSSILKHPILKSNYYDLEKSTYELDEAIINLGYFGNFYGNRNYQQFIDVIDFLNSTLKYKFKLHIFTNKSAIRIEELQILEQKGISVNEYLPYLEFLNISKRLDILLINDATTKQTKKINPYLPSKLSDYLGSKTLIMALVENGSIMSDFDNHNVIKINQELIENHNLNISATSMKQIISRVEEIVANKKTRKLLKNEKYFELKDKRFILSLSADLDINNLKKEVWVIKPKNLPIKINDEFEIKIKNTSNQIFPFFIESFYSMKNIISVYMYLNGKLISKKCISSYKMTHEIELRPDDNLKIKLEYKKNYNNNGFIEAGRLKLSNL